MIRIANAPCSWGVLEFDLQGKPAPYGVVLDEMRQSGYQGTELGDWGFLPGDPAQLREELLNRNLALLGAFVPVALQHAENHQRGLNEALKVARLLSAAAGSEPFLILADDNGTDPQRTQMAGRIRPEMGLSAAQWDTFASGVERIAKAVKDECGLRLVFHHHCGGYVETPGEVMALMQRCDPALVGLCLDTGHYQFAGGDPLALLKAMGSRVWHVHFKDCHPLVAEESRRQGWDYFGSVGKGVFCELGKGAVDFPSIKGELDRQGYTGWIVVEQDVLPGMGSPLDSATRNRQYLRGIGFE